MSQDTPSKRLFLIDGSAYLYRAYHGIRNLSRQDGFPTNAVFGFSKMVRKVVVENIPDHLVMVFDAKGKNFRHQLDENYKANRKSMPDDLKIQIPIIHQLVAAFNISCLQIAGYEADDVLGTLAVAGEKAGFEVVIVTGDKDLMQMVSDNISVLDTGKDQWIRAPEVEIRWGVPPKQVADVIGLSGDTSDNIPGVPKIGDKTAAQLIRTFGSVENVLENVHKIPQAMRRKNLVEFADQARLSLKLATIDRNVPLEFNLEDFRYQSPDWLKVRELFVEMEFKSLVRELDQRLAQSTPSPKTESVSIPEPLKTVATDIEEIQPPQKPDYRLITQKSEFQRFLQELKGHTIFSLDTETTGLDPVVAEIVGLSFSWKAYEAVYLAVGHSWEVVPDGQLDRDDTLAALKPLLEDASVSKIGQNIKYEYVVLQKYGIQLAGMTQDSMLFSHLIYGNQRRHNLDAIAKEALSRTTITFKEVAGVGKKQLRFDQISLEKATPYACEDAEITWSAAEKMAPILKNKSKVWSLYQDIEMPLIPVLGQMELTGVLMDRQVLADMSSDFSQRREVLVEEIHALAGKSFNVNSTQQLGEVLFVEQKIKGGKRTKTGFSTDVSVLTKLADQGYEIPIKMLQYRTLTKLQSTYTDALQNLINPNTQRVHTSYNQAVTLTGRLSSSDPNLQNIPIRTQEGRAIRSAFIAPPGSVLLSADYSQIELRLLAHMGEVPRLCEAFIKDQDIHTATAIELFGNEGDGQVSDEKRRMAKTINFGLVYGMSAYGLAKRLEISNFEAKSYMDLYFNRYQGVREHMDQVIECARSHGYVETLMGRRCYVPEISNKNRNLRELAERTATNAPLQGSAADLIKMAMIRLSNSLNHSQLKSKMILQVHDELVLEVPDQELEQVKPLVREAMENAMSLKVPLKVDMGVGDNWADAH